MESFSTASCNLLNRIKKLIGAKTIEVINQFQHFCNNLRLDALLACYIVTILHPVGYRVDMMNPFILSSCMHNSSGVLAQRLGGLT